jgi:hypothetical protein
MKRQEQIEKAATAKSRGETPYYYDAFVEGAEWADAHPHWISVADELPPRWEKYPYLSKDVLCTDGVNVMVNYYDYNEAEWTYGVGMSTITHWMHLPTEPMKGGDQ